jgi:hypothetical protein
VLGLGNAVRLDTSGAVASGRWIPYTKTMARPRKDSPLVVLSVRVERETADRASHLAQQTGRAQSELLRLVVGLGLEALETARERASPPMRKRKRDALEQQLWKSIEGHRDPKSGLVAVPVIVREVLQAGTGTAESVVDTLIWLDQQRRIELRGESGIGLLSKADSALCPKGPGGSPCSWLRVV